MSFTLASGIAEVFQISWDLDYNELRFYQTFQRLSGHIDMVYLLKTPESTSLGRRFIIGSA